ncbi:family 43 glycosylhydrolase [Pedobacter sp. Leaf250]|uniref:family 43 glycosylhydrolase n=1 Tax=Pedobacter sp. Leaf250 TaxID=2876559 RepID=UPI001E4608F1|nr:family 43 glycosylhydrolase [Pedobacter sp. Leaf250]
MANYKLIIFISAILIAQWANIFAQQAGNTNAIYSGLAWYDQNGKVVSAHGANIVMKNGKFYLFGEVHSDTSNAFAGFNCYSSKDLYNWKFESMALPVQKNGKLGPNRVGERVKVMKNPSSGDFVMFMHVDTLGYKDQFVGYATAKKITGPYQFKGPLLFNGKPIKKWDMGTFQDHDGTGYLLTHGGMIHQLSTDYKSIIAETNPTIATGFESPTLFRKNDTYYFIGSHLTSWEKNDNYYFTAKSLSGPWTARGLLAPKDKLTWNSQSTFVLKIEGTKDTTFMFMGDRWSFPKQHSAATYVWQPITFTGDSISIPQYLNAWTVNLNTGAANTIRLNHKILLPNNKQISYSGNWKSSTIDSIPIIRSNDPKAFLSFKFNGKQIGLYAYLLPDNGYAKVEILNNKGEVVVKNIIDLYSKSPMSQLAFLSPILNKSEYQLIVTVTGERPNWSDKRKTLYGSTGNNITIAKLIIL